jgi:hypothetical protein
VAFWRAHSFVAFSFANVVNAIAQWFILEFTPERLHSIASNGVIQVSVEEI